MNSGLCEHCLRVAYLVTDMTILLGMDEKATMDVQLAAIYHDIGKTQIPECHGRPCRPADFGRSGQRMGTGYGG